jgi:hypothetical protein
MATLSSAAAIVACDGIVDLLDAGSGAGNLIVTTTDGGGGTVLVELTLNDPAFGGAVDAGASATATLDVDPAISATASATGTAAGFALRDSDDTVVISGSVDVAANNPDIDIDNTSIVNGQTCNLTSLTVSVPEVT